MYKILEMKKDYLNDIMDIDKSLYEEKYLWTIDEQAALYEKNTDSFIVVGLDNKPIGYLNYLCITKEKYNEMMDSNITVDKFEPNNILKYSKEDNYITINSVVVRKEHQNKEVVKLITNTFLERLKELEKNNINITAINAEAVSPDGQKFLANLGFTQVKKLDDDNYLYEINNDVVKKIDNALDKLKR